MGVKILPNLPPDPPVLSSPSLIASPTIILQLDHQTSGPWIAEIVLHCVPGSPGVTTVTTSPPSPCCVFPQNLMKVMASLADLAAHIGDVCLLSLHIKIAETPVLCVECRLRSYWHSRSKKHGTCVGNLVCVQPFAKPTIRTARPKKQQINVIQNEICMEYVCISYQHVSLHTWICLILHVQAYVCLQPLNSILMYRSLFFTQTMPPLVPKSFTKKLHCLR